MADRSLELRRCAVLAAQLERALDDTRALAIDGVALPDAHRAAVVFELLEALPELERTVRPRFELPLAMCLWELGELEAGFEAALGDRGWRVPTLDPSVELPVLTERLDATGEFEPSP